MSKWSGEFCSSVYSALFVKGFAEVELRGIDTTEEYESELKMVYMGAYRYKQEVKGNVKISEKEMVATMGSQKLIFKVNKKSPEEITGTYESLNPHDKGTFKLKPGALTSQEGCNIM